VRTPPRTSAIRLKAQRGLERSERSLRTVAARSHEPAVVGEHDCLNAVSEVELAQERVHVRLDGCGRRTRASAISRLDRPRAIWLSTSNSRGAEVFEPGLQLGFGRGGRGERLDQPAHGGACEQRLAVGDGTDRAHELLGGGVLDQEAAGAGERISRGIGRGRNGHRTSRSPSNGGSKLGIATARSSRLRLEEASAAPPTPRLSSTTSRRRKGANAPESGSSPAASSSLG
jgi:hypothetical protein